MPVLDEHFEFEETADYRAARWVGRVRDIAESTFASELIRVQINAAFDWFAGRDG